ncbi:uncharacterized protein TrAtP1_010759 [Trichoderma atroviride]|uniref:Lysophospholipase n=1 Tax=Hypocrea atroviridis (strain ATCC 20476 / IMI 206040) TaxID=452589 RepID=G9NIB0_HYPAI|nr:uncharacterized protein TRIATDRAFT_297513 [Trichoderma atroviride IMI 206040]EHK49523.1 hypothetical protein TRIATDRAFT_297513 [Trichoderma atroviride IMI 206040]UKZ69755.1 hypothetical protein TrAtP1_010759 [Trichoderma atroviride]
MSRLAALLAAASLLAPTGASAVPHDIEYRDFNELPRSLGSRATDQSPKGYAPSTVDCPSERPVIRLGSHLSPQEKEWLPRRRNETIAPIRALLDRISIPGFSSDRYLANVEKDPTALPNIGLAVSGGGYRALQNGAGAIAAWDARSTDANSTGKLGGLLQSATYISGLSGGGWLVGSIYTNNFSTVQGIIDAGAWQFDESILAGPKSVSLTSYYNEVFDDVDAKDKAGFDRSITDYWGRFLSYQLVDVTSGGPGYTFSSIADDPDFKNARAPLPFLVADSRPPGETIISNNSTIFDFNPWEMGSSDPTLNGYIPLKYAGSKFNNGVLPKNESCFVGFDNVGFIMGTSSTLFNQIILYLQNDNGTNSIVPKGIPDFVVKILTGVLTGLGNDNNDIADWTPNPFKGWNNKTNPFADNNRLTLVDGGEDLQNIPYHPHLLQERKVDVVFSVDSSADTNGWPDGASPIATYERAVSKISNGTGFPYVPGRETFLNLGLNTKPVFFGCNSTNVTDTSPLIVYLPNYPYQFQSNLSTFQMSYADDERNAVITNGWDVVTQGNATRDSNWPVCVGCAMLSRSFERTKTPVPDACNKCFQQYCWNGTIQTGTPADYQPRILDTPIKIDSNMGARSASGATVMTVLAAVTCAVLLM